MKYCTIVLLFLLPNSLAAQQPLSAEEAVRAAIEHSPQVSAARSRLAAAEAGLRGARSGNGIQAEIAPGLGFTNGNSLFSHNLDVGGRRSAETRRASADREAAVADLAASRLHAAAEVRAAYFDAVRARAAEKAAQESLDVVRQILESVQKKAQIGEAPAVQATRAAIEAARAEQEVLRARGDTIARDATLNLLLGRPPAAELNLGDSLTAPAAPPATVLLVEQALRNRPEAAAARSRVEAQKGSVAIAKADGQPDAFAEMAVDTWSIDRQPFQSRNLGFQLRVAFPLLDGGRVRAGVDRAQAGVREREAERRSVELTLRIEIEQAVAKLSTAVGIVRNFDTTILPRTEELLSATRAGFEKGLSSFLEVLDAQRISQQIRTDYLASLYDAVRARISLDHALGTIPGLQPAPRPAVNGEPRP